jgi:2-oxoglutarate dehydrogenase E1 component
MKISSFAHRANAELIDQYYETWKQNPEEVDAGWRAFFEGFELARGGNGTVTAEAAAPAARGKQAKVASLIYAYRSLGHNAANLDPLGLRRIDYPKLRLQEFGLTEEDLNETFSIAHYFEGQRMTLREIIERLQETYCRTIGVEYNHIQHKDARRWLRERMEPGLNRPAFSKEKKRRILKKILQAEMFEHFLHTRYVGQKRFSLEGSETLIPALDAMVEASPALGIREIVMGMAHRGRLNVLANTLNKSYEFIFREFSENYIPNTVAGDGDVKYHLGYESVSETTAGEKVKIFLASNPSHLEAVDPVVEGNTRARQRLLGDTARNQVLPVLIHGDAAFAGQGIVAEVLNFSQLPGYRTGGTVHIIINNQIGFTTLPADGRSTPYCTDVAKMIEAPVLHVNGDDPLAVVHCIEIALAFRQKFQRDVVVDMYCYRKYGHNETDEPMFTQPLLYRKIAKHPPASEVLSRQLVEEGALSEKDSEEIVAQFQKILDQAFEKVKKEQETGKTEEKFEGARADFQPPYSFDPIPTGISKETLKTAIRGLTTTPGHLMLNPKIKRQLEQRRRTVEDEKPIDWATGESLAFATLLLDGTPVRLSGQDSERGTFSHRHAAVYDIETHERYVPLLNLDPNQAMFCVYNSPLSEASVLGFDFGYSLDYPRMLCIWEAQFGDFANGAQVIIDQFITTSESKWQRVSGIVLLLPHGYEGQGPEHSSARMERFLQACAEDNIQVCNVTTPAQIFHLLRRQMKQPYRKPLVVMSPKSLLRHKDAVSPISEILEGSFQPVLGDAKAAKKPKRLILCSGKVFYDLDQFRTENNHTDSMIVRLEQLYPLHRDALQALFKKHAGVEKLIWCQEEPQNMGAWSFIAPQLEELAGRKPVYVGREASASPAVGSLALHKIELKDFLTAAFTV